MGLKEQSKLIINGIPDRHKTFKAEVRWGFKELNRFRKGEKVIGSDSIYSIIHGQIASRAKLAIEKGQTEFGDWQIFVLNGGTLVAHKDFLAIQDEFCQLESQLVEGKSNIPWDAHASVHAMEIFFETYKSSRERHEKIFNKSLGQLNQNEQKTISRLKSFKDKKETDENIWIAMPSAYDAPNPWKELGFNENDLNLFPSWQKMHSRNTVLASRLYRDDKNNIDKNGTPRGHDYFSYIARNFETIEEMFNFMKIKGKHEGSHGSSDWILAQLLEIDDPMRENIAVGLSRDGQDLKETIYNNAYLLLELGGETKDRIKNVLFWIELNNLPQNDFQKLFIDEKEYKKIEKEITSISDKQFQALETKLAHDLSYNVGVRVLNLLLENIALKTGSDKDSDATWEELITAMLKTGIEVRNETLDKKKWVLTESERTTLFFNKLIKQVTRVNADEFFAKKGTMWL